MLVTDGNRHGMMNNVQKVREILSANTRVRMLDDAACKAAYDIGALVGTAEMDDDGSLALAMADPIDVPGSDVVPFLIECFEFSERDGKKAVDAAMRLKTYTRIVCAEDTRPFELFYAIHFSAQEQQRKIEQEQGSVRPRNHMDGALVVYLGNRTGEEPVLIAPRDASWQIAIDHQWMTTEAVPSKGKGQ